MPWRPGHRAGARSAAPRRRRRHRSRGRQCRAAPCLAPLRGSACGSSCRSSGRGARDHRWRAPQTLTPCLAAAPLHRRPSPRGPWQAQGRIRRPHPAASSPRSGFAPSSRGAASRSRAGAGFADTLTPIHGWQQHSPPELARLRTCGACQSQACQSPLPAAPVGCAQNGGKGHGGQTPLSKPSRQHNAHSCHHPT